MSKTGEKIVLALSVALIVVSCLTGGVLTQRLLHYRQQAAASPMRIFWEAWYALEESFYGELPSPQTRTYGAIRGALAQLNDPYTIFLEPQPTTAERDRLAGAYGGIGADLWYDDSGAVVLSPYPDSPAATAGVRPGDLLLEIDHQTVAGLTLNDIQTRLRGEVGSQVTLTLSRPPTPPFELTITRAEIRVPSLSYRLLEQNPSIGYLHITSFTAHTAEETQNAIAALLDGGATRLVLDLRDNGGGLIQPARDVADLFLDEGVLMFEVRRSSPEEVFYSRDGGPAADLPLVVLVNHSTASASEIVAGAIQARQRALLIGEPTYGKGSVQLIFPLSDGSSLHVTSALWLLPDHQPIAADGLLPDIVVAAAEGQDAPLERAIRYFETGE
jgi:carboxyl-terminal processing protease